VLVFTLNGLIEKIGEEINAIDVVEKDIGRKIVINLIEEVEDLDHVVDQREEDLERDQEIEEDLERDQKIEKDQKRDREQNLEIEKNLELEREIGELVLDQNLEIEIENLDLEEGKPVLDQEIENLDLGENLKQDLVNVKNQLVKEEVERLAQRQREVDLKINHEVKEEVNQNQSHRERINHQVKEEVNQNHRAKEEVNPRQKRDRQMENNQTVM